MSTGVFKSLPLEMTIEILSRLPFITVIVCKCVCKSWLELLVSNEFAKSHLSKSDPGLVVLWPDFELSYCEIYEFEDGKDREHYDFLYNPRTKLCFPHTAKIHGSANGLLLLLEHVVRPERNLYICNPITRDYVEVHFPSIVGLGESVVFSHPQSVNYGFGSSKITGKHKVVRIFNNPVNALEGQSVPEFGGHVYTLGMGSWRPIEPGAWFSYNTSASGVLVNGNLHWIVSDSYRKIWISCFDLEKEQFSAFSIPLVLEESNDHHMCLSALGDCLCLCDNSWGLINGIAIWLMKDYGVEKSWSKIYVINKSEDVDILDSQLIYPLNFFEGGDILMLLDDVRLFYYSRRTETAQEVGTDWGEQVDSILFTPSFLSLKSLGMDNVSSF